MKIKNLLLFIICLFLSEKTKSQVRFDIKAITSTEMNNLKVILSYAENGIKYHQDSTKVFNNTFRFSGNMKYVAQTALLIFINSKKERLYYNFAIDSGINNLKLRLIPEQKLIFQTGYISASNQINISLDSIIREEYNSHKKNPKDINELNPLTSQQALSMNQRLLNVLASHRDADFSLVKLMFMSRLVDLVDQEGILFNCYNQLSYRLQSSKIGIELRNNLQVRLNGKNNAKIGSKIIDFTVKNIDGSVFDSKTLVSQCYIIAFSATWCIPCQEQLPKLIEIYNKYKNQGLKVIYFNLDDNLEKWEEHVEKNKVGWIDVSEGTKFSASQIANLLHIASIPTDLLIDKNGAIRYNSYLTNDGIGNLELQVQKVLAEKK